MNILKLIKDRVKGKNMKKAELYCETDELICEGTGDNLLEPGAELSNLVIVYGGKGSPHRIEDFYWCKQRVDYELERKLYAEKGLITGSKNLSDLLIPTFFIQLINEVVKNLRNDSRFYSDLALAKLEQLITIIAPYVFRDMTNDGSLPLDD